MGNVGYEGLEKVQHAFGDNILKMHLPAGREQTGCLWLPWACLDVGSSRRLRCLSPNLDVIGDTVKRAR